MFASLAKFFRPARKFLPPPPILLTPDGFRSADSVRPGEAVEISWDAIEEIVTWKDDLWSYDEIRLGVRYRGRNWIGLSEGQPGFTQMVEEMERRFPTISRDWFSKVMFPAFVPNQAVLFRREKPLR